MKLYYEYGVSQINKWGEELCGDNLALSRRANFITLALSDGLGSGVKANILATLTTRIAMRMLEDDLGLGEVIQTLTETLPVCSVRKVAYSTFSIARFMTAGTARVVAFDSPPVMWLRNRKLWPVAIEERAIQGRTVTEAVLELRDGDWVVFVTDGVLNAGIGGLYPLGWGWEQAARFVEKNAHPDLTAEGLAARIAEAVNELYAGHPGDDVSIAVVKVRHKLTASLLAGPPSERSRDRERVEHFLARPGRHIVCGGSTASMVARELGRTLEVDLSSMTDDVPPVARLEGMDLVTEGILTLTRLSELLRAGTEPADVQFRIDGASSLLRQVMEVDYVHLIAGRVVNPAHQNPALPRELGIRMSVVREIAEELRRRGKEVTVEEI